MSSQKRHVYIALIFILKYFSKYIFLLEDEIKGKIIRKLTFQNQMSKQNCKNPASDTIDRVKKLCEVNVLDNSIFSFKTFT